MKSNTKIFVAGARGMVGSALVRLLSKQGYGNLLEPSRAELELTDQAAVDRYLSNHRPEVIVMAAAKVGGIHANSTYPAEFIYDNLTVASNVIHGAYKANVARLLFLGSSCIYPKHAPQPMVEECLMTGPLEPTNEPYAIAKIAGLKMCQAYRRQYKVLYHSAMPTNLYGPGDNYHPDNSHVIPGLIRRFHEAKIESKPEVTIWGTGTPRREFLHVDDLAAGCLHLLKLEDPPDWVNIGAGEDITIGQLAEIIAEVVQYKGRVTYDPSKPDGMPKKLMASTQIENLGWKPKISLKQGLSETYQSYLSELSSEHLRCA